MGSLYDTDVVEWAEHQAALLRRHASGETLNEPLDWANIIDEVETVGRSEVGAVESLWTLYGDALEGLPGRLDGQLPQSVARSCPITIDELLLANG